MEIRKYSEEPKEINSALLASLLSRMEIQKLLCLQKMFMSCEPFSLIAPQESSGLSFKVQCDNRENGGPCQES